VGASTGQAANQGGAADVIFPWAQGGALENWVQGLVRFLLGVIGALVTAYLFLGEFLPSMGGKVEVELQKNELDDLKKRRNDILALLEAHVKGDDKISTERVEAAKGLFLDFDTTIGRIEAEMTKERWRLFRIGFPIYVLLGGFFAAAFATNLLQALLIGFGWTAVADRFGLKKEQDVRKQKKDEQIDKLERQGIELNRQLADSKKQIGELEKERVALIARAARARRG
jgi:cell division protein FtsB